MRVSPGAVWLLKNTAATRLHRISCTGHRTWRVTTAPACSTGAAAPAAAASPEPLAALQTRTRVAVATGGSLHGIPSGYSGGSNLYPTGYSSILVRGPCSLALAAVPRAAASSHCTQSSLGLPCCFTQPFTSYSRGLSKAVNASRGNGNSSTACEDLGGGRPPESGGHPAACSSTCLSRSSSDREWRHSNSNTMRRGSRSSGSGKIRGNSRAQLFVADSSELRRDGSSAKSLWSLLAAALWPASRPLKVRVVGAVTSLLAAKCLTIAAPVALAGLIDHFTQTAAAEATQAAAAVATAAAEAAAGATGTMVPGTLLHPALPASLAICYPLARLGASAFTELRTALFTRVSQRASRELAAAAFAHMHATSFSSNNKVGELTAVLTRGTKAISLLLNVLLFQVVPTTLEFLMVLVLLKLRVGWTVAATAVATISTYWAFTAAVTTRRAKLRREMNRLEGLSAGLLVDSLGNAEVVRYFTAEAQEAERFGAVQRQLENQMAKVNESLALLNFGQQLIFTSGLTLSLLHTANLVASGAAPVGQIVLVSTLLLQLAIPLNFIGTAYRELTLNTIDLEKLQQLLQLRPLVQDPPNPVAFHLRGGAVEFRDVKFAYPPSHSLDQSSVHPSPQNQESCKMHQTSTGVHGGGKLVLDGFSLQVPAGSRVALVGESGSGKTTLIRLLYRLADPISGVVSIDGQDLKTLPIMSFRQHIGVVPQDVALFNESLGFNLRYGSPHATDEQVKEAIRLAELAELVESLPDGLDTPVGDRGLRLSGGEKQRVGIARCLLRNPDIVVFDEATSALDLHTEHKILKALQAISRGRTTLLIAHRLSTVAGADAIAVLDRGRVAEIGTHEQLLQKPNGLYASMWARQREGQTGTTFSAS